MLLSVVQNPRARFIESCPAATVRLCCNAPGQEMTAPSVSSVAELMSAIRDKGLSTKNHPHLRRWFRGHSRTGWNLVPGVYRPSFPASTDEKRLWLERHLSQDFRVFSASLRKGNETDAEIYFLQQHYRVPTRLLDWTTNPLAALYFVVRDNQNEAGELFMMDAFELAHTQRVAKKFQGIATSRSLHFNKVMNLIYNWDDDKDFPGFIMPIRPDFFDQRISRQQAYFTFHVPKRPTLTRAENSTLTSVVVPANAKLHIEDELSLLGMNDFTAFGDLDRLADWLKKSRRVGVVTDNTK
jgi:hypothetical protein